MIEGVPSNRRKKFSGELFSTLKKIVVQIPALRVGASFHLIQTSVKMVNLHALLEESGFLFIDENSFRIFPVEVLQEGVVGLVSGNPSFGFLYSESAP